MSGAARFVKKVFKQKFRFQKKYWKVAAIAVIAYFTFGLAAGAMPAGGAAMGTTAAGAGAAATGAGVMTTTAAAAGSTAAAAAGTAAAIETVTVTAAAAGAASGGAAAAGALAGGAALAAGSGGSGAQAVKPAEPAPKPVEQAPAKPSMIDKAKGAWKDMSFTDKLLLAKAGVDVVSAVAAPSPEEEAAAAAKWQGAYYGRTADEAQKFVDQQNRPPATAAQPGAPGQREIVGKPMTPPSATGSPVVPEGGLPATPPMQFQTPTEQPQAAAPTQPEQVTNQGGNRDLFAQRAPNVRYLV